MAVKQDVLVIFDVDVAVGENILYVVSSFPDYGAFLQNTLL